MNNSEYFSLSNLLNENNTLKSISFNLDETKAKYDRILNNYKTLVNIYKYQVSKEKERYDNLLDEYNNINK